MARLSWERVRNIRSDYASGKFTQRALARREGVSQTTIYRILNNINWVEK
jgi:DNA invertase Pin-like site-specific DNA recombinase